MKLSGKISTNATVQGQMNISAGKRFYEDLLEKPMINGIEISGDKKGQDYGLIDEINEITNSDIEAMFNETFRMMKEE
ncbi:hypothetical protein [Longibaculum muris]|uniref:hypothetical protein n=1 Tax=Longibaculum muris TaxID=1796628 RepID=UPI002942C9BE|nr:hypothetical protein [Longibaculum muris]